MQIKDFAVEQWMNEWETKCTHNVAETCVYSLTLDQLFELTNTDKKAWLEPVRYPLLEPRRKRYDIRLHIQRAADQ